MHVITVIMLLPLIVNAQLPEACVAHSSRMGSRPSILRFSVGHARSPFGVAASRPKARKGIYINYPRKASPWA
jgi:hypothetical protein